MRTRRQERDRPDPDAAWNEITPGLWMGGHYWADAAGERQPALADARFDLVISLFTREGHGPAAGVEHLVEEIPDGPLTAAQLGQAAMLAVIAASAVRDGRTVLVRCHSGYNRSGLVVAQTLMELGHGCVEAVELIRQRRSPRALNNEMFVEYLETGLDLAALLSSLG
jgi:hypothetical protein